MADLLARQIDDITALVTGANRGSGKQFTQALLDSRRRQSVRRCA